MKAKAIFYILPSALQYISKLIWLFIHEFLENQKIEFFISFGNTYNFINDPRKWLGEDEEQVETNRKGEENQN